MASLELERLLFHGAEPAADAKAVRADLLRYCHQDTCLEELVITKIGRLHHVQSVTGASPPDGILHLEADNGLPAPPGTKIGK